MTIAVAEARRRAIRQVYESTGKIGRIIECRFVAVPIAEAGAPSASSSGPSALASDGAVRALVMSAGPGNQAARNYYQPKCMDSLARLMNGAKSFANHETAQESAQRPERDVRELVGWWSDASVQTVDGRQGVVATFHPLAFDPWVTGVLETARQQAQQYPNAEPFVAWSVNGNAVGTVGKSPEDDGKCNLIELFTDLASTDLVTAAGARGKTLHPPGGQQESRRAREAAPSFWLRGAAPIAVVREHATRAPIAAPSYLRTRDWSLS